MAENKKQVVFEINAKKKRMRARSGKSLESATESGRVDAGRAAREKIALAHSYLSVVNCRMLVVYGLWPQQDR